MSADQASVVLMLFGMFTAFLFTLSLQTLVRELSPEKYRARVADRIARLRARITEG
jgi:hypothetical protein